MTIAKSITKTLDISVEDVRIDLTATIRSYDLTDTQFVFEIKSSNGMTVNLTGSTAMYIVEYVHNSQTYAIQGDVNILGTDTLSFNLPEDLKGYSGTVLIGIYVKLTDGTKIDIKDIAVRIEPSIMDKDIDFSAKAYFKDFESIKAEVVLEGEKAKTEIKAIVSDVQSTGDTAKAEIKATLPSLQTKVSEIKEDLDNLQNMKKILDYTSFENGYFNINGSFSYNSGLVNAWMGHRKYLSVGNAKQIVFKHSYSSKVQFNIYKFAKDKIGKSLDQIFVEPNVNHYYNIDMSDYFYAISINKDNVSDFTPSDVNPIVSLIEYDCTASKEDSVIPNLPEITVSNYVTVGKKGTEDYSDIATAYNGMRGDGYLIVKPMNYDCGERGFDVQKLYIKGCAKGLVKLENNNLLYPYASALIKNECVVENIHFKAGNTATSKNGAYAVHIEHNNTQGKTMIFRNCIFESEFQSGVGVGLRKDTNLIFENCEFINKFSIADSGNVKKPDDYTTSGALFFHGSIDNENLGTQHITCRNCTFKSDGASALRIEDVPGNLVVATFVNCNFYSKYYGTMNPIDIVGGAEKGYLCGNSVKLGKSSHGNNIDMLNAY